MIHPTEYVEISERHHEKQIVGLLSQIRYDKKRIIELEIDLANARRELNERNNRTTADIFKAPNNMRRLWYIRKM